MRALNKFKSANFSFEGDGEETIPYDPETADMAVSSQLDNIIDSEQKQQGLMEVLEELAALRQVTDVLNEKGSWSPESLTLLNLHLESIANRLDVTMEEYSILSSSSQVKRSKHVSLEGLDRLIEDVKDASSSLQQDAIDNTYSMLKVTTKDIARLAAQIEVLADRARKTPIRQYLKDITFKDNAVIEFLPPSNEVEKIEGQLANYIALLERLLDPYAQSSFRALMKSSKLQDLLNGDPTLFWQGIERFLCELEDPRAVLTKEQLGQALPGFSSLFTSISSTVDDDSSPSQRLTAFVEQNVPVSISAFGIGACSIAQGSHSYPASNSRTVLQLLMRLRSFLEKLDLRKLTENLKSAWQDALRTQIVLDASLKNANPTFIAALDGDTTQINEFIFRLYSLSNWPIVNGLLHLSVYLAAIISYCNESLKAEPIDSEQYEDQKKDRAIETKQSGTVEDKVAEKATEVTSKAASQTDETDDADEVADTGETPDAPRHATGIPKREIVEGVEKTIEQENEESSDANETSEASEDSEKENEKESEKEGSSDSTSIDVEGGEESEDEEDEEEVKVSEDDSSEE